MNTTRCLIFLLVSLGLPAAAPAEPTNADELSRGVRQRLAQKDGLDEAVAFVDARLGDDWCTNHREVQNNPELYADLVSIGRRAERGPMVLPCARLIVEQGVYGDASPTPRVLSATLFEASLIVERLAPDELLQIYQDWPSPQMQNLAIYAAAGCRAERMVLGASAVLGNLFVEHAQKHAAEGDDARRYFRSHLISAPSRTPQIVTMIDKAKAGDELARQKMRRLQADVAKSLRQRAFETYPSAALAKALAKRNEPTELANRWRFETTRWAKATKEQRKLLEARSDPASLAASEDPNVETIDGATWATWNREKAADHSPYHKRIVRWSEAPPVTVVENIEECDVSTHLFVTASDGTIFHELGAKHLYAVAGCVGYGVDDGFDLQTDAESKTFTTSWSSSSYVNTLCGPMGRSDGESHFCEVGDDVTCVKDSPLISFRRTPRGYRAVVPNLPPRLREIVSELQGRTPAAVASEAPRIRAELERLSP